MLLSVARLAIVNAPRGFTAIWNVMKPWIAKETAAKVSIMGSDYRARLLELVDADALPARLGGACTCEGLGGCMKSNAGPWMHERTLRREARLQGERDTMAVLPGELTGPIQVKRPEPVAGDAAEPQTSSSAASAEHAATPPESISETSSVESSSLGTPPPSEPAPEKPNKAESAVDEYQSHSEGPKVVSEP